MTSFTREQKMVLHLAERGLSENPSALVCSEEEMAGLDWNAVFKECEYQTVGLLCFDALLPYKKYIPQDVYAKWKNLAFKHMQNNIRVSQIQADLAEVLEREKVPYVIMKGTTSAAYYPKSELRSLGDIDFYIEKEKQDEIAALLKQNGYTQKEEWHVYHVNFEKEYVHAEMHFDFPGMPEGALGERLHAFFQPIFETSVVWDGELRKAQMPNEMYHGVIILLHMLSHNVGYGVGLRHLCDWAAYLQKTQEKAYWQETLIPLFKEIGVFRYVRAVSKMSSIYLGIRCPDWAEDTPTDICEELLIDMFTAGNFGNKDRAYSKSAQLIEKKDGKNRGPFATLIRSLHVSIILRYPIVKKVWIFYPFVFAWKVIKNLFLMCIGKRVSLVKTLPEAKKRKQIYAQLKIFEPQGEE